MKFFVCISVLFVMLFYLSYSNYHLVRVSIESEEELRRLIALSLDFESARFGKNEVELILNDYELNELRDNGFKIFTIVSNYESYLSQQLSAQPKDDYFDIPLSFRFGSMSGFYKLNEIYEFFDELGRKYPDYFVESQLIGYSYENRPIIAYLFGSTDTNKPEILLTALHHAREPATVTCLTYFLTRLFELAQNDDDLAGYLLRNRRIWVVPVVNPDGYAYNEKRYPNGGGLWRKNRRPINSSDTGVDLNRNYGPFEFWNANNNGSSTNPKVETYRGSAPFSEPETQEIRDFCYSRKFKLALNYHTYGGMFIYPFSALQEETPDSAWFRSMGSFFQSINGYYFGTDMQTVGYTARGTSDDWMYLQTKEKEKIFAATPEAGYQFDGFWPPKNRIVEIAKENFPVLLYYILSAEGFVKPIYAFYEFDTSRAVGRLSVVFQNLGILQTKGSTKARIYSLDKSLFFDTTFSVMRLNSTEKYTFSTILLPPKSNFVNGSDVNFVVNIEQFGFNFSDTFSFPLYAYSIVDLIDSVNWNFSGSFWGYQLEQFEQDILLSDSPYRNYIDSLDNYLYLSKPLFIDANNVQLELTSRWKIEPFYDFATIEVSTDQGLNWLSLKSRRSVPASGNQYGKQKLGTFGFAGYFPNWETQLFSFKSLLRKNALLRLAVLSDRAKNSNGWDIKKIQLRVFQNIDFSKYLNTQGEELVLDRVFLINDSKIFQSFDIEGKAGVAKVQVFDVFGRCVLEIDNFDNRHIDLSDFPLGLYIVRIERLDFTKSFKVIKY
ncbi:MAG: M14 family zinc carboxypeptidase [Ignavibacteria bacterium]|nr:M14 family zinc carboxypeptidase [Ignavibacteria bacterium]